MKTFTCKFTNSLEGKHGTPSYIKGEAFDAIKFMSSFEIVGKLITRQIQVEWLNSMLDDDSGWVAFVCGRPEVIRMFAYKMMEHYYKETNKINWHRVNGSRWDELLDKRFETFYHMIVLDSLLTHPPMHPDASRAYDPARIGKIHDIAGEYRGRASTIILCPELKPEEAYHISMVQPDFMFHLKPKGEDHEF